MQIRRIAAAAAAVLALASPAAGQDAPADSAAAPNGLRRGAWSLSFTSPGSGERGELGAWRMVGERTNLGITLGVAAYTRERDNEGEEQRDQEETGADFQLGLAARRYLTTARAVAPFLHGRVFAATLSQERDGPGFEDRVNGASVGAEVGVGAEWFPVRQFSVAGHTGFRAALSHYEQDLDVPEEETGYDATVTSLNTFTSALSLQIYF